MTTTAPDVGVTPAPPRVTALAPAPPSGWRRAAQGLASL